jgi:hypothetical protein
MWARERTAETTSGSVYIYRVHSACSLALPQWIYCVQTEALWAHYSRGEFLAVDS